MKKYMLAIITALVILTACGRVDDITHKPSAGGASPESEPFILTSTAETSAVTETESRPDVTTSEKKKSSKKKTATTAAPLIPEVPSDFTVTAVSSAQQIHLPNQPVSADIFDRLKSLDYKPYNCDGLPEYTLTAPDGTYYSLDLSGKWVWKNYDGSEAVLPDDIIEWLKNNGISVGMTPTEYNEPDRAAVLSESFFDSVVSAEYYDFDGTRYLIDGGNIGAVRDMLRGFKGEACGDPVIDGWYSFTLTDREGNIYGMEIAGNYMILGGTYYHDQNSDLGGRLAEHFRANGTPAPRELTTVFELVKVSGDCAYLTHDTYGLVSCDLKGLTMETVVLRSGMMLRVTWSGDVAESYPDILGGVTGVTLADDLAQPDRPDFVGEHLSELVEACRGKDDYDDRTAEADKIAGLKPCERDALLWLVENELT